jgi:phosphoenolpyruvate-protein kinase (PTS system EI component)
MSTVTEHTHAEDGDIGSLIVSAVRDALSAGTPAAVGEALFSVGAPAIAQFFHSSLDAGGLAPLALGLPASPGAASGRIACSAEEALDMNARGVPVILVRPETGPDDVPGMQASAGLVTARGGLVSHAAVIARGWGIPAVVGSSEVHVVGSTVRIGTTELQGGDEITIDGSEGKIYLGALTTASAAPPPELEMLLSWADAVARGKVEIRANVDTASDALQARRLGARGIGLCRTEHMFLAADRLPIMRRFVLSDDPESEAAALHELEEAQADDFVGILESMDGLPVTVRLLDPPLHEFLPDLFELIASDARGELSEIERVELAAVRRLHEVNPMLGTRGVRLGILRRGLYEMQVRALCRAAAKLFEAGKHPRVEIMIPLVIDAAELRIARQWVIKVLDDIKHPELAAGIVIVGAMIETPRAALTAGSLADYADFFSFGTNDLTQMIYAFSRDDVEAKLLPTYLAEGILSENPFAVLDQVGVGAMLRTACEGARSAKPTIKLGVCGEHAGDPASIEFLVGLGIDSLSCSPFRLPVARLATAQALLASGRARVEDVAFDFEMELPAHGAAEAPAQESDSLEVDEALVLHVLRVRGFVDSAGLIDSLGADPSSIVEALIDAGLVRHIEARGLYGLLPEGKQRQEQLLSEYASAALQQQLTPCYEHFLPLNSTFKELCHDWQLHDGEPNDHSDAAYDQTCIERLMAIDVEARRTLEPMATVLPRLARYATRLQRAADAVASGDITKFTGVLCGSFHDIWMELHGDLIVLLGIDRAAEGSF